MFKWIFLSLIFTPYCKYTYSKNNVKFLRLTSSELHQELLKLYRIACCFKLKQKNFFNTFFEERFVFRKFFSPLASKSP